MEGPFRVDMDTSLADMVSMKLEKKNVKTTVEKILGQCQKNKAQSFANDGDGLPGALDGKSDSSSPETTVSEFDYSVDNHFQVVDKICELCGETECKNLNRNELERLSSSITFLREWKHFNYQPRVVRFACESESSHQGKDAFGDITLPQFSSAAVPKKDGLHGDMISQEISNDFVMYVGGPVWALDWCPRVHRRSECDIQCEFVAIAAHPPESSYHKIGVPLVGRGIIQIWCLLTGSTKEEDVLPLIKKPNHIEKRGRPRKVVSPKPKRPRGRPRKQPLNEFPNTVDGNDEDALAHVVKFLENSSNSPPAETSSMDTHHYVSRKESKLPKPKRPRGRPRKKPLIESPNSVDGNNAYVQALAVQFPENFSNVLPTETSSVDTHYVSRKKSSSKRNGFHPEESSDSSTLVYSIKRRRLKDKASAGNSLEAKDISSSIQNENIESSQASPTTDQNTGHVPNNNSSESQTSNCFIPKDIALPRVVLCLAHNGKVAWDAKWRPSNDYDTESKHRMGYLAVLLGSGALEVWEVPLPQTMKVIHSSCQKQGTDPRFVKLEPIFRCSKLKCGDRQSIPLTVEWSTSATHDFILAGCHDGVVALWKFSANGISKDTRPLLCFSADTVPIRAVAWAPAESDPENANVIVTAGHRGLKFWDIRDPFRALWDLNPVQRNIYSLDWLPDPRCVIVSFDDGTLRILSLVKAAYDVPVTGKPFIGTQQQGFSSYYCSSSPIWSVQVSRLTGMVAYCSADGNVLRFQLTTKAVEKDPTRNRAPHFLCGSLCEEESGLTVVIPQPDTPFPMKKSLNEWGDAPRSIRGFLSVANQAKRAKEQMAEGKNSGSQTPALCYGDDDPGIETEFDDTDVLPEPKQKSKAKTTGKKRLIADQTLVCRDEQPDNVDRGAGELEGTSDEIETLPSKLVAMHRVRWNMNKGSERWLCYGGAAGIVRCQEISRS